MAVLKFVIGFLAVVYIIAVHLMPFIAMGYGYFTKDSENKNVRLERYLNILGGLCLITMIVGTFMTMTEDEKDVMRTFGEVLSQ